MNGVVTISPQDMECFACTEKIGLLGTVAPQGFPHLTLITTLQACGEKELVWGQFTEGLSKRYVKDDPRTGFLILTMDRQLWRGRADYRCPTTEGPEYELLNAQPMFRYNTYFGIHTAHYMDLVAIGGREQLPLARIVPAAVLTSLTKRAAKAWGSRPAALTPWAVRVFNRLDSLKFLGFIGAHGYPVIIPLLQCQAADLGTLAFSRFAYKDELAAVPDGATVAVHALTMAMESVLVRGTYRAGMELGGLGLASVDINYVYNCMPPNQRQLYPPVPLEPVRFWRGQSNPKTTSHARQ